MVTIQPAQRRLFYTGTMTSNEGTFYIDLAKDLSAVNRRLYRQGMQYYVESFEHYNIFANDEVQSMACSTAGDTWTVHNAWKKAFAHWKRQQREARKLVGQGTAPTWEDFKIYLDDAHRAGGTGSATGDELSVLAADGGAVGSGEWIHSKLIYETDDQGTTAESFLHLIGPDVSTTDAGLILNYQKSRVTVQSEDPEVPAEYSANLYAYMARDENEVMDEVANNMEDENDAPPYDLDDYVGNDTNADAPFVQSFSLASPSQPLAVGNGFLAECGLIKIDAARFSVATNAYSGNPDSQIFAFSITVAPGPYKGVMAEPMGQ